MGRNSDKRQKRRGGDGASAEGAPALAEAPAAAAGAPRDAQPIPLAPARSLAGRLEIPNLVVDGSLARALFHITCLLSVRDARGVVRENLTRTAREVASIVGADTVSLMRLEKGDDLVPPRLALIGAHGLRHHASGDERRRRVLDQRRHPPGKRRVARHVARGCRCKWSDDTRERRRIGERTVNVHRRDSLRLARSVPRRNPRLTRINLAQG